jgi:type III secretion protein T
MRDLVLVVAVSVARPTAMFLITPFLGRGVLTGLARNGVILALSLPVMPLVFATRPEELATSGLLLVLSLVLKEMLIGFLLGLPFAVLSWGLEAAGFMIDNQRGSTMASSLNPATGDQSSPVGILLAQVYTVWLFTTGGFLLLLSLLYQSHRVWPVWMLLPPLSPGLPWDMLAMLDKVMRLTVLMAGPALIAMFLSEFGLALVSRFAPQLQVFFLAMPLKSAVGILLLVLSLGIVLGQAREQMVMPAAQIEQVRSWLQ